MGGETYGNAEWDMELPDSEIATLWGVYVNPLYRGGKQGLLIELYGCPYLKRAGFRWASTTVRPENPMGEGNWRHWDDAKGVKVEHVAILASLGD